MLWYLIKTWVGREEELVREIRRTVPSQVYNECFVIYQERIWRKQQRSIVHVEPLFPGCVFLTGKESEPILHRIVRIPTMARLMDCGSLTILPMTREDGNFLEKISGNEHLVRLSYVLKDEAGNICRLSEPLKNCQAQIERIQFKKRYAMVRCRLWGEEQVIVLGIILKEDADRKLAAGNIELPVEEMAIG